MFAEHKEVLSVKSVFGILIGIMGLLLSGCVPMVAKPEMLTAPKPQPDASLEYLSPYTSDGVMCEWTDKMANVSLGAKIGGTVATVVAQQALKQIPFAGAFLGVVADRAGEAIGRKIAIEAVGGWDYIKSKSDQSFATVEELTLHTYSAYCYNEHYQSSLRALMDLYPELKRNGNRYNQLLVAASKDICRNNSANCVRINELHTLCGRAAQTPQKPTEETVKPEAPATATTTPPAAPAEQPSEPSAPEKQQEKPAAKEAAPVAEPAAKEATPAAEKEAAPQK